MDYVAQDINYKAQCSFIKSCDITIAAYIVAPRNLKASRLGL